MEKGQLLRALTENGDERLALSRVLDQWARCRSRNIPAVTRFLTPQEQALAEEALRRMGAEGEAVLDGGYEDAERRCALFLPDYLSFEAFREDEEYPVCAVRCSFRAGERPTHRDFLGSLMGLGICGRWWATSCRARTPAIFCFCGRSRLLCCRIIPAPGAFR